MTRILLILFVVGFNVCGHVFLKTGMNQIGSIGISSLVSNFTRIFFNWQIMFGLFCYVSSVAGYLVLLSKADISVAYPVVTSLAYGAIVIISFFLLKEPFTAVKWAGLGLILVGVLLIGAK